MKNVKISSLAMICAVAVMSVNLLGVGIAYAQPFAWKDEKGRMMYGDNPPSQAKELRDLSRPVESEEPLPELTIKTINTATADSKKRPMPSSITSSAAPSISGNSGASAAITSPPMPNVVKP